MAFPLKNILFLAQLWTNSQMTKIILPHISVVGGKLNVILLIVYSLFQMQLIPVVSGIKVYR